jgi:nitrous oxide reductase accessory protein NosL
VRLLIACLSESPVLILDEPRVNLDPEGAIDSCRFLLGLRRKGKTIVFSSHMLADVERLADGGGIFVGGWLAFVETVDDLFAWFSSVKEMSMRTQELFLSFVLAIVLSGAACISSSVEPVEIYPEDVCSRCRMAISDKRFAGEIMVEVGVARKFDDLGCLLKDLKEHPARDEPPAFAVDFGSRQWINMKKAYFVRSPGIVTPMGSGLIAFKNRSDAERAATKYGGQVLNYADLTAGAGENKR